ncbi:hypothetical protein N9W12_08185, partial [Luminiphilus sp.]|nr:hypothetical protein [Luminiphilus sp.]
RCVRRCIEKKHTLNSLKEMVCNWMLKMLYKIIPSALVSAFIIIANASAAESPYTTLTTTYACQYVHSSAVREKDDEYRTQTFRVEDPFFIKYHFTFPTLDLESEDLIASIEDNKSFSSAQIVRSSYKLFSHKDCEVGSMVAGNCSSGNTTLRFNGSWGLLVETRLPESGHPSVWTEVFKCEKMGNDTKSHDDLWDFLD